MIKERDELKQRFLNGMKPTETDFANALDSFYHRRDRIPAQAVDGLPDTDIGTADDFAAEARKWRDP